MGVLTQLYDSSPVFVQNLMCSLKGWTIKRRRYNADFYKELEHYEMPGYKSRKELCDFLRMASTLPFYQHYLTASFIDGLDDDNVIERIKSLPIINKQVVKENLASIDNTSNCGPYITMHTSGTTGSGLVFPYSVEFENKQWAIWWKYRRALGIQLDTWCGWFGGRSIISIENKKPPFWRVNKPGRQVMYSTYHLNKETVGLYYADLCKRKLEWLTGYPSTISLLASLINESRLKPIENVKWITTGAENLLEHQIQIIKLAFPNAMVRTHYGLTEGVANFSQDKEGKWHIDSEFAYAEFIPVDDADPSVSRIIGTGFSNKAFPLIRYDTGDLAKIKWTDGNPEIIEIYGRQEDYIELPNGVKLGRLDHIFKDCVNIREAQIHQIRKDLIELRVVKDVNYTDKDEKQLVEEASSRFGKDVDLKITYCDTIERTKAGKVRFVVSELNKK